jgi:hypothetical protein
VDLDLVLREQCEALVERSGSSQPFGLHVLASTDPAAELGRTVERAVFGEFFGNTPELLAEEYDAYEASSVFLCVIDHRRMVPAGVSRVIVPSAAGFKSVHDIARVWDEKPEDAIDRTGAPIDLDRCHDVATLATTAEYRGAASEGLVSLALYQAIIMSALASGRPWLVAVMDVAVIDLLSERIGSPFSHFPGIEPRSYLDSPASLPVYVDLPAYGERLAEADEAIHSILFRGVGLEAAVWTRDWEGATSDALARLELPQAGSLTAGRGAGRS